jgi:hypothetical protein
MKASNLAGYFFMAAVIANFSAIAYAVPVKYPDCAKQNAIVHPDGSGGAYFNETCTAIYVLPPLVGVLTVNGYTPSANLQTQCTRLSTLESDQLNIDQFNLASSTRLLKYNQRISEIEQNLQDGLIPVGKTAADLQKEIDSLIDTIAKERGQLATLQDQDDNQKYKIAAVEGGRGKFLVMNQWSDVLKAYQKANAGKQVQRMILDQSFLSMNEQVPDKSNATAMAAVIKLAMVGVGEMPPLVDPMLLVKHPDIAKSVLAPNGSKIFADALSGEIQLSSVGGCAIAKANAGNAFSANSISNYIASSATYSYQVQVKRNYTISYKVRELVRQIHEQTKKGGFFSTSTLDSFIDNKLSSSWLTFTVTSDDQRQMYTDEYIQQVKKEFMDRALVQIMAIQTGNPAAALSLIAPGKNGASEAGEQLSKCPNMYCQIGAAAMKVLGAIFGSETATSSLLKTLDGEVSETVNEMRMVPEYGTSVYQ